MSRFPVRCIERKIKTMDSEHGYGRKAQIMGGLRYAYRRVRGALLRCSQRLKCVDDTLAAMINLFFPVGIPLVCYIVVDKFPLDFLDGRQA